MNKVRVAFAIQYLQRLQADGVDTVPVCPVVDGAVSFSFNLPADVPVPENVMVIALPIPV